MHYIDEYGHHRTFLIGRGDVQEQIDIRYIQHRYDLQIEQLAYKLLWLRRGFPLSLTSDQVQNIWHGSEPLSFLLSLLMRKGCKHRLRRYTNHGYIPNNRLRPIQYLRVPD